VLEILPGGGDHGAEGAAASLLFAAGDPAGAGRYGGGGLPAGAAFPENPDTVCVDARGRAWIGTDHGAEIRGQAAGLFLCALDGPRRGLPMAVYGAPRGAAIGGAAPAPEGEAVFAAVCHPGAGPGQSFARPGTRWPQFEPGVPPRTALVGLAG
jgi:secreted PhoX family phosphatase